MCWLVKHRWTCSPLLLVAMGTCLIIIDSLCMCLSAFIRALLNLVIVSFECKDINTQVWGEFCDLSYWIVNDEDAYKVMHRSISCAQWTQPRYRSCALWFTNKIALAMMSEQLAEGGFVAPLKHHPNKVRGWQLVIRTGRYELMLCYNHNRDTSETGRC